MIKSNVSLLAQSQLDAYNQSNLDLFCACYHSDVQVLDEDGSCLSKGIQAFRQRYVHLFTSFQFGAKVTQRLVLNHTCIDEEEWWRIDPETSQKTQGRVLVRYTEIDGKIAFVQFFR